MRSSFVTGVTYSILNSNVPYCYVPHSNDYILLFTYKFTIVRVDMLVMHLNPSYSSIQWYQMLLMVIIILCSIWTLSLSRLYCRYDTFDFDSRSSSIPEPSQYDDDITLFSVDDPTTIFSIFRRLHSIQVPLFCCSLFSIDLGGGLVIASTSQGSFIFQLWSRWCYFSPINPTIRLGNSIGEGSYTCPTLQ